MAKKSTMILQDGIIEWYDGPEWDDVAEEVFSEQATHVKESAQSGAIWEDRTGDARAGLDTLVENVNGAVTLSLFHTVDYGQWLETIQNGRFAIIMRTLEEQANIVFREAVKKISLAREGDRV